MINFIISYAAGLSAVIALDLMTSALPIKLYGLFGSNFDVGLIFGSFPVVSVLLRTKISKYFFSIPLRKALLINLTLLAISHAGYIFAHSRLAFIVFRSVYGIGLSGFYIVLLESVNNALAPEMRRKYYGIFATLFVVSMLFAPALGVSILRSRGFAFLIAVSIAVYALSALFVLFIKDSRSVPPSFDGAKFYSYFRGKHPHFVLLFLIIFVYSAVVVFLPRLAGASVAEGGRGLADFAFAFTFISASTIIVRFAVGTVFTNMNMTGSIVLGAAGMAFAVLGFALSATYTALFFSAAVFGAGWAFFESNYIPSLLYGSADKSELITAYSVVFDSAWFVGPLVCGAASGLIGVRNLYLLLPVFCVLAAVYFLKFGKAPAQEKA